MKTAIKIVALTTCLLAGLPVTAATPTDTLSGCLVDAMNGRERKNLAKWVFLAMAAHPDLKPYSNATANDITESNQFVGTLITRLLTEDCPNELKSATDVDPLALQNSFRLVGQVAMQELMTNQETVKALTDYVQYTDQDKINAILGNK